MISSLSELSTILALRNAGEVRLFPNAGTDLRPHTIGILLRGPNPVMQGHQSIRYIDLTEITTIELPDCTRIFLRGDDLAMMEFVALDLIQIRMTKGLLPDALSA